MKLSVNPNTTEYLELNSNNIQIFLLIVLNLALLIYLLMILQKTLVRFFRPICPNINTSHSLLMCCHLLRDFSRIRPFNSEIATITLANAFVYSYLDFCCSRFYGLLKYSIHRLQKVQSTVARISLLIPLVFLT